MSSAMHSASTEHKQAATEHEMAARQHRVAAEHHDKNMLFDARRSAENAMECCNRAQRQSMAACAISAKQ